MAVLDNDGIYYKLDYNKCYVQGNRVFVYITKYASESERVKEKNREKAIAAFLQKTEAYLVKAEKDSDMYNTVLMLREKFNRVCRLYNDEERTKSLYEYRVLDEFGFDSAWIDEPVRLAGGYEICCGEITESFIPTHEFYYNMLKRSLMAYIDV